MSAVNNMFKIEFQRFIFDMIRFGFCFLICNNSICCFRSYDHCLKVWMISSKGVLTAKRCLSTASSTKTAVLLVSPGQPRTEFYAKEFLQNTAAQYYNVPEQLKQ